MVTLESFKKNLNNLGRGLLNDLKFKLDYTECKEYQKSSKYQEWIGSDLAQIAEEFVSKNDLLDSYFMKRMKHYFKTDRFQLLLKKWVIEYYFRLFAILNDKISHHQKSIFILEDNPLNQYGVKQYRIRFGHIPIIEWRKQANKTKRVLSIIVHFAFIIYFSLKKGLKFSGKRIKYAVMREALWGLYDRGGYYYHDDFFVDGDKIKKEDLLLFSRGIQWESGRVKARLDARRSDYTHFDLNCLSLSANVFIFRIFPKYLFGGGVALSEVLNSPNFSLFSSIFAFFVLYALPYEKVFSHYEVVSELGHNYFSANHIPEAIICQNYGVKYYLMHWSDNSVYINRFLTAFLNCDKFLIWGKAHIQNKNNQRNIYELTGYIFKRFIREVKAMKSSVLLQMGIKQKGKIISFYDESFGGGILMTAEHYVTFWNTALELAKRQRDNTIIIKPKGMTKYLKLPERLKKQFLDIKKKIEQLDNIYIIDEKKWSFIESIGVSDIVVTQSMTSSATIAIICGINGLYLDQLHSNHPFQRFFKDKIVFDDPDKLLAMLSKIIHNQEEPIKYISEGLMREYDAFDDDCGIDRFRSILAGL